MSTVLVKPVGDRCNLACRHCYYHPGTGGPGAVMERPVLGAMTRGFLAEGESPTVFAWQGGEPTLAGIEFYQRALETQARFAAEGQRAANTLQTNGVVVDDAWAEFLAQNDFLVGLSIDGPAECHDTVRQHADGRGSHAEAVRAWRVLRERGGAVNVLCTVHRANCERPAAVYRYLTDELGADHIQFIPCVEWTGEPAAHSVRPGEYGRFLVRCFDLWAGERARSISIKLFDDFVLFLAGKPMRDCMHRASCDSHLVVERDGSVYPCDFFVSEEWLLGNVLEQSPTAIRATERARAFREGKARELPEQCRSCRHLDLCRGGCRKFWTGGDGGGYVQYLCEDMRYFLDRRRDRLEEMARVIRARWRRTAAAPAEGGASFK